MLKEEQESVLWRRAEGEIQRRMKLSCYVMFPVFLVSIMDLLQCQAWAHINKCLVANLC